MLLPMKVLEEFDGSEELLSMSIVGAIRCTRSIDPVGSLGGRDEACTAMGLRSIGGRDKAVNCFAIVEGPIARKSFAPEEFAPDAVQKSIALLGRRFEWTGRDGTGRG